MSRTGDPPLLWVGLGNPGEAHARDRHNVGAMALRAVAERRGFGPWRKRFSSLAAEGAVGGRRVVALLPQTWMNLSGDAVGAAARFRKTPPGAVLVMHDEIDLAPGRARLKTGGGDAGHNGLRSITAAIGPGYRRLRIGVGRGGAPGGAEGGGALDGTGAAARARAPDPAERVLSPFSAAERRGWLARVLEALAEEAHLLAADDERSRGRLVEALARAAAEPGAGDADTPADSSKPRVESPAAGGVEGPAAGGKRRVEGRAAGAPGAGGGAGGLAMGFSCGLVGLPNAGKSTLFNALGTGAEAKVADFAFCTVDPNVGRAPVPDPRLATLARLSASERVVPTSLEVSDIAGLVEGAHAGEGLGNRFLAQIREVDLLLHVLRCFPGGAPDAPVAPDPAADAALVATELALADLESLERQGQAATRRARGGDPEAEARLAAIEHARPALEEGRPARSAPPPEALAAAWRDLRLLTAIPVLYVANVSEDDLGAGGAPTGAAAAVAEMAAGEGAGFESACARLEAEIAALDDAEERREFLAAHGLDESGLDRVVRAGHDRLGLLTFFTTGPKETRAWTVPRGARAPEAAGRIHGDMERGFIRAETIAFADFEACGGEAGARAKGLLRAEGRGYEVQDGDVMHFRFSPK